MRQSPRKKSGGVAHDIAVSDFTSKPITVKKQRKITLTGKKQAGDVRKKVAVDTSRLAYRSNINGVIKTVQEINLTTAHERQLRRTPFWAMINSIRKHNLSPNAYKKCDETVFRILQTYNVADEKFYIGGEGVPLRRSDIQLVFGIQCGVDQLDLAHGSRPPSDFIQRRCNIVGRISCKKIKELLDDAVQGDSRNDEEDVAKLLSLYICAKLFFTTTGESIGWAFVRVIDKLSTVQLYDWAAAIRAALIASLNEFHDRPERVTGCVVVLLFFICEHTNLIEPARRNVLPRFCRWNIANLTTKMKEVDLSSGRQFEVRCGKLEGAILERYKIGTTKLSVESIRTKDKVLGVQPVSEDVGVTCNDVAAEVVEPSLNCWQLDSSAGVHVQKGVMSDEADMYDGRSKCVGNRGLGAVVGGEGWPVLFPDLLDLSSTQPAKDTDTEEGIGTKKINEARDRVAELEEELRQKSERVCELECKVTSMERALGSQAANLCMGFENAISLKDAEIARLNALVSEMETKVARLEDQVDEYEAHEVTQLARNTAKGNGMLTDQQCGNQMDDPVNNMADVVGNSTELNDASIVELDVGNTVGGGQDVMVGINDVVVNQRSALRAGIWTPVEGKSRRYSGGTSNVAATDHNLNIKHVLDKPGSEVVDRVIDFVNLEEPNITSLVRRVKSKARRTWRLQDYEYTGLVKRCRQSKDDGNISKITNEDVFNIEGDERQHKTWAGFGMKNRYPVWKLLAEDEQKLLEVVYTFEGDGAVIWSASEYGVHVNFKDIQSLVQGGATAGNVIDAYAEILKSAQNVAAVNCANFSKSYFHSSVCSDMMSNRSITSKDSYLNVNVTAAAGCRYVHYPIYHANHWTTMVYDSDSGTWTHYNSIKTRKGSRDDHFAEAVKVKQWVVDYTKRVQGKVQAVAGVTSENMDGPLEALGDCPQQHPESPDCAVMVCFIMRQYANNVEVEGSMDGMTASAFRAEMVKAFINDPRRGLRNRPLP